MRRSEARSTLPPRTRTVTAPSRFDRAPLRRTAIRSERIVDGMLTRIGSTGDTLDRLHRMVEDDSMKALGRARASRDCLDTSRFKEQASEREALEDMALADLAAELGMPPPAAGSSSADGTENRLASS